MSWGKYTNFTGKLTSRITSDVKLSLLYIYNDGTGQGYSHGWKYNPDGRSTSYNTSNFVAFSINHMLSPAIFYDAKISYIDQYDGYYVFKNPYDAGYVHDLYDNNTGPGFYTGGQERGHTERWTSDLNAKLDLTWQVDKNHSIKGGADLIQTDLEQKYQTILNYEEVYRTGLQDIIYTPWVLGDSSLSSDIYHKKPMEFAAYIQDKMEFDEMVINLGLRYDYFNPNTTFPSDRRNPVNLIQTAPQSNDLDADSKYQLSPRLGLSYQLGDQALLRLSYGHFFQRPPYQNFYQNNSLLVSPQVFSTQQGNPQLKAQKTVQYELGLWQMLMKGMSLEVSLFYRDIYDLLSMAVMYTYNYEIYGLYTNLDYGNAKGLEIAYDF